MSTNTHADEGDLAEEDECGVEVRAIRAAHTLHSVVAIKRHWREHGCDSSAQGLSSGGNAHVVIHCHNSRAS